MISAHTKGSIDYRPTIDLDSFDKIEIRRLDVYPMGTMEAST